MNELQPGAEALDRYTALLDLARHNKQVFQRQLSTSVFHVKSGILAVAVLTDTYHDMRMAILVDPEKREIAEISAVMLRYPFTTCPEAPEVYQRLKGLKLFEAGTLKRIHQLIPRREGCTHLYAVLEACLRALFIGGGRQGQADSVYEQRWSELSPEQRRAINMRNPMLKNSCHSFSKPASEEIPADLLKGLSDDIDGFTKPA